MKVFVSPQFEEQTQSTKIGRSAIETVIGVFESMTVEKLTSDPTVSKLHGEQEDVYVYRYGDLRFFFTIRGDDAVLIGVTKYKRPKINVSRGAPLNFAADGKPAEGIVVATEQTFGPWASVTVETETPIPDNAQLSIPDLPETGGCGLAQPIKCNGRVRVVLSIGYSYIDLSTIRS